MALIKGIVKNLITHVPTQVKKIICPNGSTIKEFENGAIQIKEITYGANHKYARRTGLSKLIIQKNPDGKKTFTIFYKDGWHSVDNNMKRLLNAHFTREIGKPELYQSYKYKSKYPNNYPNTIMKGYYN
jgi:hypothetical protein